MPETPLDLLTRAQAAAIFNVHPKTINNWARAKKITSWRLPGGQSRYSRAELESLLERAREDI